MNSRTLFTVLALALFTTWAGAADEIGRATQRVKLTEQAIRSERRLYRKSPEGELFLHLYFPADWKRDDARPVIVFFFGGGWKTGSYQQFVPQSEYFASRGLVAASADYRIRSKHGTGPEKAVEDAKAAVSWVRAHAPELGIDANKIIASGGSAGGHLAASAALLEGFNAADGDAAVSSKPNALVLFNPVLDLTRLPQRTHTEVEDKRRKQLSPTLYLRSSAPPAILFYGTEDKYLAQGQAYIAQAKALGVRADLYVANGMSHGFFQRSPWTEVTAQKADEFLASQGYLDGAPTIKLTKNGPRLERK
jgi:acetyl esterase/lipase